MKFLKSMWKKVTDVMVFLFSFKGDIAVEAVNEGLCDHSGQGRNSYGK